MPSRYQGKYGTLSILMNIWEHDINTGINLQNLFTQLISAMTVYNVNNLVSNFRHKTGNEGEMTIVKWQYLYIFVTFAELVWNKQQMNASVPVIIGNKQHIMQHNFTPPNQL